MPLRDTQLHRILMVNVAGHTRPRPLQHLRLRLPLLRLLTFPDWQRMQPTPRCCCQLMLTVGNRTSCPPCWFNDPVPGTLFTLIDIPYLNGAAPVAGYLFSCVTWTGLLPPLDTAARIGLTPHLYV